MADVVAKKGFLGHNTAGFVGMTILFGASFGKFYDYIDRKANKLIPGPYLGSLYLFNKYWYINLLHKYYGKIFMLHLNKIDCVYITDAKLMRQLLKKTAFCHHKKMHSINYNPLYELKYNKMYLLRRKIINEAFGINLINNYLAKTSKNVCNETLLQPLNIYAKTEETLNSLDLSNTLKAPIFKILFAGVFGNNIDIPSTNNNINYLNFMKYLNTIFDQLELSFLLELIYDNSMNNSVVKQTNDHATDAANMVRNWVKDAIKNVNISGNNDKNCMISYLLDKNINDNDIVSDILAVFFGIHTVGRTLTEAVLLAALYPDIQQKLYNELITHNITCDNIDEYILKNKDLILDELHYLKAFLYESMRVVTHGFFQGVARIIEDKNVTLNGYSIKKGTVVLPCYPLAMHDTKYWKNPYHFDINNFLDSNNKFKNNIAFCKFGVGKRDCPGIILTKKLLMILFSRLLLTYKFESTNMTMNDLPTWNGSGIFVQTLFESNIKVSQR